MSGEGVDTRIEDYKPTPQQVEGLTQLVESHRKWAATKAAEILKLLGGVFDHETFTQAVLVRNDISPVIGGFGATAHTALHDLLAEEARSLATQTAEA